METKTQTADYNRLRWRCRRGMRELDTVLLYYLEHHYTGAGRRQQAVFEQLLERPDPDLYFLLMGKTPAEHQDVEALVNILRNVPRH